MSADELPESYDPYRSPGDRGAEGPKLSGSRLRWQTNVVLFVLTVFSVFFAGMMYRGEYPTQGGVIAFLRALSTGWTFAVPLLGILLTHEFGHYFAARIHKVDASLPYFLPLPFVSPFG